MRQEVGFITAYIKLTNSSQNESKLWKKIIDTATTIYNEQIEMDNPNDDFLKMEDYLTRNFKQANTKVFVNYLNKKSKDPKGRLYSYDWILLKSLAISENRDLLVKMEHSTKLISCKQTLKTPGNPNLQPITLEYNPSIGLFSISTVSSKSKFTFKTPSHSQTSTSSQSSISSIDDDWRLKKSNECRSIFLILGETDNDSEREQKDLIQSIRIALERYQVQLNSGNMDKYSKFLSSELKMLFENDSEQSAQEYFIQKFVLSTKGTLAKLQQSDLILIKSLAIFTKRDLTLHLPNKEKIFLNCIPINTPQISGSEAPTIHLYLDFERGQVFELVSVLSDEIALHHVQYLTV